MENKLMKKREFLNGVLFLTTTKPSPLTMVATDLSVFAKPVTMTEVVSGSSYRQYLRELSADEKRRLANDPYAGLIQTL